MIDLVVAFVLFVFMLVGLLLVVCFAAVSRRVNISGVTSHRQPRQCRGAQGPKTAKGAQSDPNYVSRLLLDCVPVFHIIIIPAYLLYRS